MDAFHFLMNYWRNINPQEAKKVRILTVTVVVLGILAGLLNTVMLAIINEIINSPDQIAPRFAWIFVLLLVALPVVKYISETQVNYLFMPIFTDLMRGFMRKFMSLPFQKIEMEGSAKYHAILAADLRTIYNALRAMIFSSLHATVVLSCLIFLGWLSLPVLGYTLLFLVFGLYINSVAMNKGNRHYLAARSDFGKEINYFQSIVNGINEFKLHRERRIAFFEKMVEPVFKSMRQNTLVGEKHYAVGASIVQVLYFILIGTILFGSLLLFDIEREVLTGYALAVLYIFGPLTQLVINVDSIFRAKVSVQKLRDVGFDLASDSTSNFYDDGEPFPPFEEVRLKDLFFHYGEKNEATGPHNFALGPVDFSIKPGEVVIVTGGNGSGKTTLAKLIAGLYEPISGDLYYNDIRIDDNNRDQFRQTFSAIFVNFYLFDQLLGMEHIPNLDQVAREHLKELQIDHKLTIKDGKLSTTDLSQGQRKRLALAIAFLEDRPFYIFDEWTTHQDPMLRDYFYKEILPSLKKRGKAVLVISHDDKYFLSGDRIVKMELGKKELDVPSASLTEKENALVHRENTSSQGSF